MASSTGFSMDPSSGAVPFPFPTEEETCKSMQKLLDSLLIKRMHNTGVINPVDLGQMTDIFQMIASGFVGFIWKEYQKLHESRAIDVRKLVDEKADLEKRLSSVTEKLNLEMEELCAQNSKLNSEMEEVGRLNSKLNREMEEVRGLNSKLNCEMEELCAQNSKLNSEMEEVGRLNSKLKREMEEVRGLNSKLNRKMEELCGQNSKVSNRLVELRGEIELARVDNKFIRSKNKRLCSKAERARVENERLQGLVDGFGAKEHAIKLKAVNEFASGPRFYKRFTHFATPDIMLAGQMGVDQMAKIAGVPPVPFMVVPGYKFPTAGHYRIPKLGEVYMDNEHTLEAWNVTELYNFSKEGLWRKRKANDLGVGGAATRPRTHNLSLNAKRKMVKRKPAR